MHAPSPLLIDVLDESRRLGFLGDGDLVFHVEHARGYGALLPADTRSVLDLGSGGGLPGLVVASDRPDLSVTLLDANERRCAFLETAIDRLALAADVRCGRAELLGRDPSLRGSFDVVVARSFGAPPVLAECAAPFLREGGHLIVSEPPEAQDRWSHEGLALVGLEDLGTHRHAGLGYRLFVQRSVCPDRYPRRVGIPAKRPLFELTV